IGITLKEVIDGCRDRILSPYLIHSRHQKQPKPMSKDNLSDYFAKARDLAGITPPAGKTPPTFHEQRSLSERLYRAQGIDTKTLLGHKVQATTDRYNDTRGQEWVKLVV
ncbi:tyrosine-type recombinase/integrase, partial [Escherichia coli]|nr:tyrosine-type recombinase/integrase [Escherichia coli]